MIESRSAVAEALPGPEKASPPPESLPAVEKAPPTELVRAELAKAGDDSVRLARILDRLTAIGVEVGADVTEPGAAAATEEV